jgi:hypothetical protein
MPIDGLIDACFGERRQFAASCRSASRPTALDDPIEEPIDRSGDRHFVNVTN